MKQGIDFTGVTVVFYCHDGKGNFLLAKRGAGARDENGRWDGGGGALDFGDSVEDTLKKEIREEYCTEVLEYEFLGYRDVHRVHRGQPTHWLSLDFKVLVDRDKVKNGEPHKLDELGWFRLGEFPEDMHSQAPMFIEPYRAKLS